MSLNIIKTALDIELSDDFHIARLLLLLKCAAGRSHKPMRGIMKLAKIDFLIRYPNCLARVLKKLGKNDPKSELPEEERDTIEARMIRFRFGPWDTRYRRWIGIMVAKGLAQTFVEGRTVNVKLTEQGMTTAAIFAEQNEFEGLLKRAKVVIANVGEMSPTRLKDFIYEVFPELLGMQWGTHIEL